MMNDLQKIQDRFSNFYYEHYDEINAAFRKLIMKEQKLGIMAVHECKDENLQKELAEIILSVFRKSGFDGYCLSREEAGLSIDAEWIVDSYDEEIFVFNNFAIAFSKGQKIKENILIKYNIGSYKVPYLRSFIVIPFKSFDCENCDYEFYSETLEVRKERAKGLFNNWSERSRNHSPMYATECDLQNYLFDSIEKLNGWCCRKLSPRKYGKGVPDVLITKPNGEEIYIELKSPQGTGVLKMEQIIYHEKLREQGKNVKIFWQKEQVDKLLENDF